MNMLDAILGANNGAAVRQLASQFGMPEEQTTTALGSLVPALAAGLQRNAESSSGLSSLLSALAGGGHARYVEDPATLAQPDAIEDGKAILGHVFGSKDVSRQVASRAAAQTGIGEDVLKRMLPAVATLVMGTLATQQPSGSMALAGPASAAEAGGSLMSMLTATLDRNRDGSIVDDLFGMLGAFRK